MRMDAVPSPPEPQRPYGSVGTPWTRGLAKLGIVFGLVGFLTLLIAYFSYRRWQQGYFSKPRFAWFWAAMSVTLLTLVGILAPLGYFPPEVGDDLSANLSGGALVISVVVGVLTYRRLPASPVVASNRRPPPPTSTGRRVAGKGKPERRT